MGRHPPREDRRRNRRNRLDGRAAVRRPPYTPLPEGPVDRTDLEQSFIVKMIDGFNWRAVDFGTKYIHVALSSATEAIRREVPVEVRVPPVTSVRIDPELNFCILAQSTTEVP